MKIIIPATSANLGPGFDSVGVALSRYLTIEVLEKTDHWWIEHHLDFVPHDEQNLLVKTALSLCPELEPHHLKMSSDIPLARGLGSSSSVIVGGIELANQLGNLQLSKEDKLRIATEIEGHPDNVAPAIYGNLVIANYINKEVSAVVAPFPEVDFIAFIPSYPLRTQDSRKVLPNQLSYKKAVAASAIANVAVAALLQGNLLIAGKAMEADQFHEQYRQQLIPEFYPIRQLAREEGAYATYLSGAGPTVMILSPKHRTQHLLSVLESKNFEGEIALLSVDAQGVHVENKKHS